MVNLLKVGTFIRFKHSKGWVSQQCCLIYVQQSGHFAEQGLEITGEKELALVNISCAFFDNYGNYIWRCFRLCVEVACLRRGDKKMIELRKITGDNIDEVIALEVEENQKDFI